MSDDKNNADHQLREFLDMNTRRRKWNAVVEKYEEYPELAQKLKLSRQGDTALHLAVIDNQEEIVEKLVKIICRNPGNEQLLETTNERNNNPLHLAAAQGSARMCHAIASANGRLVDMRNVDDETPLFLAAAYGHMDAFYCLYYFCRNDSARIAINCREKNNGDTVLHRALRDDHFELAFQLIHMNNDAMSWVNEKGLTPLHVLASYPTSFKSGSHIRGWQEIVYYCTCVDKLKPQPIETLSKAWTKRLPKAKRIPYSFPDNYETCIEFFMTLKDAIFKVITLNGLLLFRKKKDVDMERENLETVEPDQSEREVPITNFPKNYTTCVDIFQIVFTGLMIILGFGSKEIKKIVKKKQKHTWSVQVMEKLFDQFGTPDKYGDDGKIPDGMATGHEDSETFPYTLEENKVNFSTNVVDKKQNDPEESKDVPDSAMLLAAKNGVLEMVRGLSQRFPLAIHDTRNDKKNVLLLAAEYRQPQVYRFLHNKKDDLESLFRAVDVDGNGALHLAAAASKSMVWRITGDALQMQWEVKWYKFIEESMPLHFFTHYNKEEKTASTIFHETHMDMVKNGGDWLTQTSKSCSVVGTLIVTVAFTSATTIPGGYDTEGVPFLEKEQSFFIFAVSSLIALCLSSASVTMFLAILTSRFEAKDFGSDLPWKLFIGLSSLFFSIVSTLISFCAGHYFLIDHRLRSVALLLYTLTFLPVAFIFLISKLPLYIDVVRALVTTVPRRSADVVPPVDRKPSKPLQKGKFEVSSIRAEIDSDEIMPLVIFTPSTQDSYPVILFLPGCVESFHSDFLRLVASHGFVIVAPELEAKNTESTSQVKSSDREMVEEKLSKLSKTTQREGEETPLLSLALASGERPSHPFSEVIGFDPMPGTKLHIPNSQIIQTHSTQSSHTSAPILQSEFVISNLCGHVKLLD